MHVYKGLTKIISISCKILIVKYIIVCSYVSGLLYIFLSVFKYFTDSLIQTKVACWDLLYCNQIRIFIRMFIICRSPKALSGVFESICKKFSKFKVA